MFVDNCFEEMMEGYRMSTRRIYLEGLKETDENADKKIYAGKKDVKIGQGEKAKAVVGAGG